ncbi:glycosyltransferase [Capnocytophaga cynodegmi]|uniref:glycosyltransferase n=1 Tax=Capnocytophaga cynodegmi TaxID=28189 RepID=UPI00385CBDA7
MKQKILYFVPDCPVAGAAGNITRFKQMLGYLNQASESCEVDFVSISDWGEWNSDTIKKFKILYPNINLILLPRKIDKKKVLKSIFLYKIPNAIPKLLRGTSIDISNPFLHRKFTKIINSKLYDKIIISYATWGSLIKDIKYKSYLIVDTHDFITAQNRNKKSKIGKYFQTEIDIINRFDEIWTFSSEEKYIFEQFSDKKVVHQPIAFEHQPLVKKSVYKYDIIYVASRNPHNIKGINWFLNEVLPLIDSKHKVHIIGRIGQEIKQPHHNVIIHGLVDDITDFYQNCRITICPMLSGTGVKIKVLESLSYNIPVVTNRRGVDGLSNKSDNGCVVADCPQKFAEAINQLISDDDYYRHQQQLAFDFFSQNHNLATEKIFFNRFLSS